MRHRTLMVQIAAFLLVASLVPAAYSEEEPDPAGTATRLLPTQAGCGETITITLSIEPGQDTQSWVLEETIPDGVTIDHVDTSNLGEYNDETRTIKWLSLDGEAATHTYRITVPAESTDGSALQFAGEYRFSPEMEDRAALTGDAQTTVSCVAPEPQLGSILRVIPQSAECGTQIEIGISVAPPIDTDSWFLDEQPPSDLEVVHVDPVAAGEYVPETGTVKWVATSGAGSLATYRVDIPETTEDGKVYTFTGSYRLHPQMDDRLPIDGDETLVVDCPPPEPVETEEPPVDEPDPDDDPADGSDNEDEDPPNGGVPDVDDLEPAMPGSPFATRIMPAEVRCGQPFLVALAVAPALATTSWILEEFPPGQAAVSHVSGETQGGYIEQLHAVKWVALLGESAVHTYRVTPDANLSDGSLLNFTGESRAHPTMDERVPVLGHKQATVRCDPSSQDPSTGGSGGSGGGGGGLIAPRVDLKPPTDDPAEFRMRSLEGPAGSLWTTKETTLSGSAGDQVRFLFPDDPDDLEILFTAGSDLDQATVKMTRWLEPPSGTGVLPSDFESLAIVEISIEGAAKTSHEIELSVESDGPEIDPSLGVLLNGDENAWSFVSTALHEGQRLVATGPCCSVRAIGWDTAPPRLDLEILDGPRNDTIVIETDARDNVGMDSVRLYHNGDLVTDLDFPLGGYILDTSDLELGNHSYQVVALDAAGLTTSDTKTWEKQVRVEQGGNNGDVDDPAVWTWLLLLPLAMLAAALSTFAVHRRRVQKRGLEDAPVLFITAEIRDAPEGALVAYHALVTGREGSAAKVILDDEQVPAIALLLGSPLYNVPLELTKWDPADPPADTASYPELAAPIFLLNVNLPKETKGVHPVLMTISLPEQNMTESQRIYLFSQEGDDWRQTDPFQLTLDPDGMYRGTALADRCGMLMVALAPPPVEMDAVDDEDVDEEPDAPEP